MREARLAARTALAFGVDFLPIGRGGADQTRGGAAIQEVASVAPSAPERPTPPVASPSPAGGAADRAAMLEALRARHDAECPHCTRATAHTRTVFGEGDCAAGLMFIGEAPGAEEDRTGRPFVGRAGQKLDEMIRAMGLTREAVYIANVLKARPPDNATPTPEEADRCGPFLRAQIAIVRPRVIVALGRPATQYLLGTRDSMANLRGRWAEYADGEVRIAVMPTYHPAFLLRQYTKENRERVWSDLKQAMERLRAGA